MHEPDRLLFARTVRGLGMVLLLVGVSAGCNRQHYRQRADKDVEAIITQKNVFPDWSVKNWNAYPHPDARYADPGDPDHPPYPPDDYAVRVLAPNPQHPTKRSGTGRFEGRGYLEYLGVWDVTNRAADVTLPTKDMPEKLPLPKGDAKVEPAGYRAVGGSPVTPASARGVLPGTLVPQGGTDGLITGRSPRSAPAVTETHDAGMMVVAGEMEEGGRTVPTAIIIPSVLPAGMVQPVPKADGSPNPKADPPGKGDGSIGFVATGEAAASVLKVLESQQKGYRIKLEQAVQLGIMNAREFQDRREDVYLTALPVTLQRFSFAAQGFFTEAAALNWAGRLTGTVPQQQANLSTQTGFNKLFPTGALLAVKLANQVVVDLTGDRPTTTLSNFSLSLAQPFLRGGGYAVTLEPLTQSERDMVYAIRSYARFRKLFFVAVAAGGGYTNNPYGLQGLAVNLGRGVGSNLTAPSVGYLQLLLQAAVVANQRRNVDALEQFLRLYEAFREGGQQSDLQVGQVEIQLLGGRNTLLGTTASNTGGGGGTSSGVRGYLDTLDNFKLQLGLPLTLGLDLDASPLGPVREQIGRFDAVYADLRAVEEAARQFDPAGPIEQFRPRWRQLLTESALVKGTEFAARLPNRWATWERLNPEGILKRMGTLAEERRLLLDRRTDRLTKQVPEPESEIARLAELERDLDLGAFEQALRAYEARPWANLLGPARGNVQASAFRDVFNVFYQLALDGRNERLARIRQMWPPLPGIQVDGTDLIAAPIDDSYTAGLQAALTRRLDLMNARAQVVDSWRQIKVTANALQGVLNVQYNLSSNTPPGGANPVAFSGGQTTNNLTFQAQLPLVRRAERNNYRSALIGYQRQRRNLQAFEDNICNDVRGDIRELRVIAELYRVQQRLIELAYSQVDNGLAVLLQPPVPGAQNDAGSAAALTNQLLNAQQNLVNQQNTLYTIWVNYMVSRMSLFADTELLQIDESGGWNDESLSGRQGPGRVDPGAPGAAGPGAERLPPPPP
ncbi:MAG TPA: TolC family protein, partial [Urbifossiella sp.]|nr:TolC family protein [Urbifossiella sp.]